ncbi:mitochondrial ribonuclease P protein 1 like protein [Ditylenchus destructor]|nr:mitochondrial ribonuclease P protein 1 like protein [Ditylenchus destructor]
MASLEAEEGSTDSFIRRMSPGFGIARNGQLNPCDDVVHSYEGTTARAFGDEPHYRMVYEANFHSAPFEEQCQDWTKPCIDVSMCRQINSGDLNVSEQLRQICAGEEYLDYYELAPSLDLFLVDKYGTIISKLTDDVTEENSNESTQYSGEVAVSCQNLKDKPVPFMKLIFSQKCEHGLCLHEQLMNAVSRRDPGQSQKISLKEMGEEYHGFFGGASFPQRFHTEIVFHGHKVNLTEEERLKTVQEAIDRNIFPTNGSHLYMLMTLGDRYADGSKKRLHQLTDDSNPNIVSRLWPSYVGTINYLLDQVIYTAITKDNQRQLRALDICSKKDILISTGRTGATNMMGVTNSNGTRILFVSDRDQTGASKGGLSIFIADLNLDGKSQAQAQSQMMRDKYFWEVEEESLTAKPKTKTPVGTEKVEVLYNFEEQFFENVKQLTFGGIHSRPHFSTDGKKITFQAKGDSYGTDCEQVYEMDLTAKGSNGRHPIRRLSTGFGRAHPSGYYRSISEMGKVQSEITVKDQYRLISSDFLSTEIDWTRSLQEVNPTYTLNSVGYKQDMLCRPKICAQPLTNPTLKELCDAGVVWEIYPQTKLYRVDQYTSLSKMEFKTKQFKNKKCPAPKDNSTALYESEGAFAYSFESVAYTRKECETCQADIFCETLSENCENDRKWITDGFGFKGGAAFSSDDKWVAFHAILPKDEDDQNMFKRYMEHNLVFPYKNMEIYIVRLGNWAGPYLPRWSTKQVTNLGKVAWAPVFVPNDSRILFTSDFNSKDDKGQEMPLGRSDLFIIDIDGNDRKQVTHAPYKYSFDKDATMAYSPTAWPNTKLHTKLVWASTRGVGVTGKENDGSVNLFMADWIYEPKPNSNAEKKEKPVRRMPTKFDSQQNATHNLGQSIMHTNLVIFMSSRFAGVSVKINLASKGTLANPEVLMYRKTRQILPKMSIRSRIQPSSILMAKIGNQTAMQKLIERIGKEYEVFEYFYHHPPKHLENRDWEQMLNLRDTYERVHFWSFLSKKQYRREKDENRQNERSAWHRAYTEEQDKKHEAGGMGYARHLHWLYRSQYETRFADAGRSVSPYIVGDMPQLAFDMQYVLRARHIQKNIISNQLAYTIIENVQNFRRSFPVDIVNADVDSNPNMARFFGNIDLFKKTHPIERLVLPEIKADNPHQSTSDSDPTQQVVYISRYAREMLDGPLIHKAYVIPFTFDNQRETLEAPYTGRYRMMCLPLDKYLKVVSGTKYVPFVEILRIFGEVANGSTWCKAIANHVPVRKLIPPSERSPDMAGLYKTRMEKKNSELEMAQIILDSLGPEEGVEYITTNKRSRRRY